jgi:hypothetical protein
MIIFYDKKHIQKENKINFFVYEKCKIVMKQKSSLKCLFWS